MTATDPEGGEDDYEFPDPYGAYREHLDACPLVHTGLLANCVEGARLAAAWLEEDWPGYGAAGTTPRFSWGERTHA
ncbi:hypothetical protein [Streptomyces sp. NRRL B-1347]|uniref:hypothetical protein n=1 Tax=Streptomyces sp. NRRL B-1347 TaxID=1476877 RepID=UPI0004C542FC|nr:hypothetical protein [Streptomyces sp. NRRL B-1347]